MRAFGDVEPLDGSHRLADFDCGSDAQTVWLRRSAMLAHSSGTSRVWVVRRRKDEGVAGFYALATGQVMHSNVPRRVAQGTGRHPIPVIVLTRLAVDLQDQGHGLGRALVVDALRRTAAAADLVGIRALLIHAEDDDARSFYLRLAAFEPSPTDALHLFLLMKDLRRALTGS
ncbi:GNAT family N-acetyltransferase [Frankia sp. Cr2]|uniref:GNAT family N-acetyltransferase n=1 Tax=Frankia sp. Cr2 TaxID=3073932 RepID=UPI002AD4EB3F|nr:GNAT family N-acetyltransferase [Frankia sp. Cr2]